MPTEERTITERDLDAFSQKLDEWAETLPENEQTLLRVLLNRAKQEERGVEGSRMGMDFGRSVGDLLGPAVAGGITALRDPSAGAWMEWIRDWTRITEPSSDRPEE